MATILFSLSSFVTTAQNIWRAQLIRQDGNTIVFNFQLNNDKGKHILYIINGAEKFKVDNIHFTKDSVFIQMPVLNHNSKRKLFPIKDGKAFG
jgi:hypothetical protein